MHLRTHLPPAFAVMIKISGAITFSRQNRFFVGHDAIVLLFSRVLHSLRHFMAQFQLRSGSGATIRQRHFRFYARAEVSPHMTLTAARRRSVVVARSARGHFAGSSRASFSASLLLFAPHARSGQHDVFQHARRRRNCWTPYLLRGESGARQLSDRYNSGHH